MIGRLPPHCGSEQDPCDASHMTYRHWLCECILHVVSTLKQVGGVASPESFSVAVTYSFCFLLFKVFVFGTLTEWLRFYNKWLYCCLWIVNGLLQSTGWPCVVAIMGNWFGKAGYATSFLSDFSV